MDQKIVKILSVVGCLILGMVLGYFIFDDKPQYVSNYENETQEKTEPKTSTIKEEVSIDELENSINNYLGQNGISQDQVGIAIRRLDGQGELAVNADTEMLAASVYKLPLAMIWYEKVNNGEISLQDTLYYDASYYEAGAGVASDYGAGSNIPLETLLHSLIINSDNTAGHILFEHLGGWTEFKEQAASYAQRQMDIEFYSYENVLTANYTADVIQYLYDNKQNFEMLITDMRNAMPNNYLDLKIDTNVAQKYGSYDYAENSVGFVEEAKVPYSIVVFTSVGSNGVNIIGDINQICFDYFNK